MLQWVELDRQERALKLLKRGWPSSVKTPRPLFESARRVAGPRRQILGGTAKPVSRQERSDPLEDASDGGCSSRNPVLPVGVRVIAWDYASLMLPKEDLSAVVFEGRLLILPIHEDFLDPAYERVHPDQSVWDFLGIQGRAESGPTAQFTSPPPALTFLGDVGAKGETQSSMRLLGLADRYRTSTHVERDSLDLGVSGPGVIDEIPVASAIIETHRPDLEIPIQQSIGDLSKTRVVALARPIRPGSVAGASAVELSGVGLSIHGEVLLLDVDLCIEPGELAVILGARKRRAQGLMAMISGSVAPTVGLVLHHGVPSGMGSLEDDPWSLARPGFLGRRCEIGGRTSAVEHASFPMLVLGFDPVVARRMAASCFSELGAESLIQQPVHLLVGVERQVVSLARALAAPWPVLYLYDPFAELAEASVELARQAILRRNQDGAAVIILSDDGELLTEADRIFGVSGATVFEAVHR